MGYADWRRRHAAITHLPLPDPMTMNTTPPTTAIAAVTMNAVE
jgi:hypothetical protein